jgi:hypothetical protein
VDKRFGLRSQRSSSDAEGGCWVARIDSFADHSSTQPDMWDGMNSLQRLGIAVSNNIKKRDMARAAMIADRRPRTNSRTKFGFW